MITDESLHGRRVLSADGLVIGDVEHSLVEPGNWRIQAIEVKLRNEVADRIGAQRGMWRAAVIDIPTEQVQSIGDAIILSVPVTGLSPATPAPGEQAPAPSA